MTPMAFLCLGRLNWLLCFIELVFGLLAAGAAPVVGEVFEGDAVVLVWIVDVAAH